MPLSSGDPETIGGYVLLDRLGSGGMGVVYLARSASGRRVAVKLVHAQFAEDEEFRVRFRQEIAAVRRVSGAFTAPVVDADPTADRPWMATLYVPGPTLAQRIAGGGPLGATELRSLALGLTEALRDIHQAGVVHRDLKPANVLIAEDGPRVIDFGISRAADNQALTVTGRVIGTPPFMSPEQLHSPRAVQPSSDIFSLAALLVYAATGHGPFDADSPYMTAYQVIHEPPALDGVPPQLLRIAERCLDKDPDKRPDLAELLPLFRELPEDPEQGAEGPEARPAGPVVHAQTEPDVGRLATVGDRHGQSRGQHRRLFTALGAALAVVGLAVGAMAAFGPWDGAGGSGAGGSGAGGSPTAPTDRVAVLPAGWQPWQTELRTEGATGSSINYGNGCLTSGAALYCGGEGFTAARIDAATGEVGWRFTSQVQTSAPVAAREGIVVVNDQPSDEEYRVTGLHADSGKLSWSHRVSGDSTAMAFGDAVAGISPDGLHLAAWEIGSGEERWRSALPAGYYCRLVGADSAPYAVCSSDNVADVPDTLLRFDPEDGTSRELGPVPPDLDLVGLDEGALVFLRYPVDEAGNPGSYSAVSRLDTRSGAIEEMSLPKSPELTLEDRTRIIDGTLYAAQPTGTVVAVSARTGELKWTLATEVENLSAPVLSEKYEALYFVNQFGRLLALREDGRGELWHTTGREGAPGGSYDSSDTPQILLVKDAIVGLSQGLAFSVSPGSPSAAPSAPASSATSASASG